MMMYLVNIKLMQRSNAITISIYNYWVVDIAPKFNTVSIIAYSRYTTFCCYCCRGTCLYCIYHLMMMSRVIINMIHCSNVITISFYNYSVDEIAPKFNTVSIIAYSRYTTVFCYCCRGTCLYCKYHIKFYRTPQSTTYVIL
jgi:hypothetical protein